MNALPLSDGQAGSRVSSKRTPPRRLRRLHRVWPDRDGNISYLITLCVEGRAQVLANDATFERLISFLLEGPVRYRWFGRRFVVMPDHVHIIAHVGHESVRLGEWVKALKAVVGGLKAREEGCSDTECRPSGLPSDWPVSNDRQIHTHTRIRRSWRWQEGFHDHKLRTPESEARKWEYVCLNPVRAGLVKRPEEWPFGGEIFYQDLGGPVVIRGTPPLLDVGMLIEEKEFAPGQGTRPASR